MTDEISDDQISIGGYVIHRKDRMKERDGGVCIYVSLADSCHTNDEFGSPKPGVYVVKGSAATVTKTASCNRIMRIV